MQNKNYMYLVDNKIQFYDSKNCYLEQELSSKILENGKIIHRPKFLREFKLFLKKNHILKKLQKNILYIITPPNFKEVDKEILRNIFEETSFQEIKLSKETNRYQVKKNTLWINLNQDYAFLIYTHKKKQQTHILKNNYLNKDFLEQLIIFLKENPNFKKIYILGTNKKIPEIAKNLEIKTNKIVLYFENARTYLLDFKSTQ